MTVQGMQQPKNNRQLFSFRDRFRYLQEQSSVDKQQVLIGAGFATENVDDETEPLVEAGIVIGTHFKR